MPMSEPNFVTLEALVRRDPAGRGVAAHEFGGGWLAAGGLKEAARHLAGHASRVAIVTGFRITHANPPAAETDGPPGALFLARALESLGVEVVLVADRVALPLLEYGCRRWSLRARLCDGATAANDADSFLRAGDFSHLISIEHVGPSHTLASLAAQRRPSTPPIEWFDREVPAEHRDVCHNMRGQRMDRDDDCLPLYRLFETAAGAGVTTIGIGDGGNEIGMGALAWESLRAALPGERAGRIICRIATDHLVLAGVSNWGGYALALAVAALRDRGDLISSWTSDAQRELIEGLVREAGAVDGVTGRREPTVDGLPLDQYLALLDEMRASVSGRPV
jgi:D-glutamate cyclase